MQALEVRRFPLLHSNLSDKLQIVYWQGRIFPLIAQHLNKKIRNWALTLSGWHDKCHCRLKSQSDAA